MTRLQNTSKRRERALGELLAGCGPGSLKMKKAIGPDLLRSTERLLPAPHCASGRRRPSTSDTMPVRQRWLSISVGRPRDEAATAADSLSAVQGNRDLVSPGLINRRANCTYPASYAMRPLRGGRREESAAHKLGDICAIEGA